MDKIDRIIKKNRLVLPILKSIQKEFGCISETNLRKVSKKLNIPLSELYGVATFYSGLSLEKEGKYKIRICNGISCYINGSLDLIKELESLLKIKSGETSKNRKFSLMITSCIGCCDSAPAMRINGKLYENLTKEKVRKIIKLKCR